MKAQLKAMIVEETSEVLSELYPKPSGEFALDLRLVIGVDGKIGGDDFYLTICTPAYLSQLADECYGVMGCSYLIINHFDYNKIKQIIERYICYATGDSWYQLAMQIGTFARWEFDNYQT